MKISDLAFSELSARLKRGDLLICIYPFVVRIHTGLRSVARGIALMYGDFELKDPSDFADFHVHLSQPWGVRRWIRPQVDFVFDETPSFRPLPLNQAFPMLEWGMNWCISSHAHQYLIIHAAVLEKHGRVLVMPAPPGSGKSTLCTGLVSRGWRLLSDELALLDIHTGLIQPLSRPINLKNQSIEVIQRFWPDVVMTQPVHDTIKGTVALVRPPAESVRRVNEPARPAWIVLPRYQANAAATLTPHSKAQTFMLIAEQTFNYDIHGKRGFELVGNLVDQCECYQFVYSDLEEADRIFTELAGAKMNGTMNDTGSPTGSFALEPLPAPFSAQSPGLATV